MNKKLLTSDELIKHMKQKGITFNIVDETKAKNLTIIKERYRGTST